jgi:UDP-N-acetylglucosamine:LPS N-acetylglucosamine transferase
MLAGKAEKIFVAYPDMNKFFPAEKIVLTGNPIRSQIRLADAQQKASALAFFGLDPHKKTLLVIGGSLGAATLNRCMIDFLPLAAESGIQVIWQCGTVRQRSRYGCNEYIYEESLCFCMIFFRVWTLPMQWPMWLYQGPEPEASLSCV